MATRIYPTLVSGLTTLVVLGAWSITLQAQAPKGWYVAGSKPADYETGIDASGAYNGHPSAFLKAKKPVVEGFGTLMQDFSAGHYAGKRVRFSAFLKTEGALDWAGLWMRVDKGSEQVAFDNMQNRSIKGTTNWQRYEVVLDVPQDATGIFFGVLLGGSGEVWLNDAKFETVDKTVPTTGRAQRPEEPTNLDFTK